jgi:hypothetical protein
MKLDIGFKSKVTTNQNKASGLYYKHITVVNDDVRLMLQIVASHLLL